MFNINKTLIAAALLCAATFAQAQDYTVGALQIEGLYARATVPGVQNSAAWFTVKNTGATDDRIVDVRSSVANSTEIHDMKVQDGVMRMFKAEGIEVPAGNTVKLGEGNKLHVMFLGLKSPLKEGESFALTIRFEKAGSVEVNVPVKAINPARANAQRTMQHQTPQGDGARGGMHEKTTGK